MRLARRSPVNKQKNGADLIAFVGKLLQLQDNLIIPMNHENWEEAV